MQDLISAAILVLLITGLNACQKDKIEHDFYFFIGQESIQEEFKLYVDGEFLEGI